jgi:hypothetical protein
MTFPGEMVAKGNDFEVDRPSHEEGFSYACQNRLQKTLY